MWILATLRLMPRLDPLGFVPVLAFLAVWAIGTEREAHLFGQALDPVVLAIVVRAWLQLAYNAQRRWRLLFSDVALTTAVPVLVAGFAAAAVALWVNSATVVQIAWSVYLMALGVTMVAYVLFAPGDLYMMPTPFARNDRHLEGAHLIIGAALILQSLCAAAMARWGSDAGWVLFVSLGHVALHLLTNWIVILWMMTCDES
ncbi:MAG: Protein of unknown function (DUF1282) [Rhodobacteraceae bacterium HLUCCA08]|nr:MAG: Protein of unknown function (DUF1282) [Rhodobacteraceae bacterium HLUCCA08]